MSSRTQQIKTFAGIMFFVLALCFSRIAPVAGQPFVTGNEATSRFGSMNVPLFKGVGLSREAYVKFVTEEIIHDMACRKYENFDSFMKNIPLLDEEISVVFLPAAREIVKASRVDYLNFSESSNRGKNLQRLGQALKTQQLLEERSEELMRTGSGAPRKDTPRDAKPIQFPDDEGLHVSKLIEWWYYTGHLTSDSGRNFGFEVCYFRFTPFIYFAHFAISDIDNKKIRYVRKIFSPASVLIKGEKLALNYGNWGAKATGSFQYDLWAEAPDFSMKLQMSSLKPPMLIGDEGIIKMGDDANSYYYTLTRNSVGGSISIGEENYHVNGTAWMDHQWGNFFMSTIWGWDWFSLQLDNNMELNIFSFHNSQGEQTNPFVEILNPDNTNEMLSTVELTPLSWWTSPQTRIRYPSGYRIYLPEKNYTFTVIPKFKEQEIEANPFSPDFIDYWEGACSVSADLDGAKVEGQAYNEICGYKKVE